MSTQDIYSSDIISFMKSLSEKFDILKKEVENLKKPNPDKENFFHLTATWIPQEMSRVMTHLQTLLGLRADRLSETDESRRGKDTLVAEAHVWSRADRMDEDQNEIPDYSQDPHFSILRKKRYKI